MKLPRTVAYTFKAVLLLAESPSQIPIPCSQLASVGRMPERFLLQSLRTLVKHGILQSTHGPNGGYTLKRRPDEISLLDLFESFESLDLDESLDEDLPVQCQYPLMQVMKEVNGFTREKLAAIKIADFLPKPDRARQASLLKPPAFIRNPAKSTQNHLRTGEQGTLGGGR